MLLFESFESISKAREFLRHLRGWYRLKAQLYVEGLHDIKHVRFPAILCKRPINLALHMVDYKMEKGIVEDVKRFGGKCGGLLFSNDLRGLVFGKKRL